MWRKRMVDRFASAQFPVPISAVNVRFRGDGKPIEGSEKCREEQMLKAVK